MDNDLLKVFEKLMSSHEMLRRYESDPAGTMTTFGCSESSKEIIMREIDIDQLKRHAKMLRSKRFHEVAKRIPTTIVKLGYNARSLFEVYSDSYWPEGHRRHKLDAYEFMKFLFRKKPSSICWREYFSLFFWILHHGSKNIRTDFS